MFRLHSAALYCAQHDIRFGWEVTLEAHSIRKFILRDALKDAVGESMDEEPPIRRSKNGCKFRESDQLAKCEVEMAHEYFAATSLKSFIVVEGGLNIGFRREEKNQLSVHWTFRSGRVPGWHPKWSPGLGRVDTLPSGGPTPRVVRETPALCRDGPRDRPRAR